MLGKFTFWIRLAVFLWPMIKISKKAKANGKSDEFEIRIDLNRWQLVQSVSEYELIEIRDCINDILGLNLIATKFEIDIPRSEKIQAFQRENRRCETCAFKMVECFNCVLTCQSPLERDLFLALLSLGLNAKLQQRINNDGKVFENTQPIDKVRILTIPDFYIETTNKNYCIYTDGHTYHERTESQALRDRNIDRELQILNFVVLRYTGREIREKLKETALHIYNNATNKTLGLEEQIDLDNYIESIKPAR